MSFQGRLAALEGKYFREEEVLATRKAVEKLIEEGKLPSDALKALDEAQSRSSGISSTSHDDSDTSMHNLPTTVNRGRQAQQGFAAVPTQLHADAATVLSGASVCCRQNVVYNHVPGILPVPRQQVSWSTLGTPISFGRARWTVDDASIFSVADGKKLAQTPHNPPTFYERLRAEKLQRAALETPLVRGMRLLPEFTPGRAMLWGTILAVWGTAAVFASTARSLDIKTAEDAPEKLRGVFEPIVGRLSGWFTPTKTWVSQS
eukprot:jgi/Astpho2/5458/fgenesh1_pg.00077_%23_6_t